MDHRGDRPLRHVLTVLPSAERSGPTILAVDFLRWLHRERPGITTSTLLLVDEGGMRAELAELGPVVDAGGLAPWGEGHGTARVLANRVALARLRRRLRPLGPVDVAHVHCVGAARALPALPAPAVIHAHELEVGFDLHAGPAARRHLGRATGYVAASHRAGELLTDRAGVPPDRVLVRPEWVDPDRLTTSTTRAALGIDADEHLVLMTGVTGWRKAPDLFLRAALLTVRRAPEIRWRFVWVGSEHDPALVRALDDEGLDGRVTLTGPVEDVSGWLSVADTFLLTSREDTHPVAGIEAALVGLPIVCFDTGGTADQVIASGGGAVVAFPDVDGLAAALVTLARDPDGRARVGRLGRRHAERSLLVDSAGPELLEALERAARASAVAPVRPPSGPSERDRTATRVVRSDVIVRGPRDAWRRPSLTIEVVWRLLRRRPDLRIVWEVDDDEDAWLARHDVANAGLDESVAVTKSGGDHGRALVVDTATEGPADVLGLGRGGIGPLDVEALVDELIVALDTRSSGLDGG